MNTRRLLLAMALFLLGAIALTYSLVSGIQAGERDPAVMNDVVATLKVILSVLSPYVWIGFAFIMACILGSYAVLPLMRGGLNAQTGLNWSQGFDLPSMVLTLVLILGLVMAVAYGSARKIRKLPPIMALRSGIRTHSFKKNRIPLEKSPGSVHLLLA